MTETHPLTLIVQNSWVFFFSLILALTLLAHFGTDFLFKRLQPKIDKTHLIWDSALLHALITPFKVFIWLLGLSLASEVLSYHLEMMSLFTLFKPIRNTLLIILLIWFSLRFIKNIEHDYVEDKKKKKKKYDNTTVRAICQISRITIFVLALLIYLQSRNINISAVLAFGGAGGLVVGFAAKDLLANLFGGMMIYFDRPFSVGDWIRSPDKEIEGTVEHIGWRLTRIRTFDKRPLYVPNGFFSTISVENPSRMTNRRIKTQIGIRYDDASKMKSIVSKVEEMILNHPEIDSKQFYMVRFEEFSPSSMNFIIYCFTKTTDWGHYMFVQEDVFLKTVEIIQEEGAQCAFPTTTLHIPNAVVLNK